MTPPTTAADPPLAEASDEDLVARCRRQPEAFAEVVRRHQAVVFGAAFRVVHDPTAAEDLAQEAFLRAFKALDDYRGEGGLAAWLYRIARNLALNSVTRSRETPTDDLPDPIDEVTPESEALRSADIAAVRAALQRLPEALRRPLVLREYRGMAYEEIAECMGLPVNTIKTRIHRAKQGLEHILGGER
jgi:RNA polymerase sigma-70 factor (ECF subfamily)